MEKFADGTIPEMQGFMVPTTVDELVEIIALMPHDMAHAAMEDGALVAINRLTSEVAVVRPCEDGTWDVAVASWAETAATEQ